MRATLDRLISWMGLILALILLVGGILLTWANSFIGDEVYKQLSDQHITMPTEEAFAEMDKADQDALKPFAGEKLTTGPAAKAYADHYILVHMNASVDATYSALGMESPGNAYADVPDRAVCGEDPEGEACSQLRALKDTLFRGSTLRGLLLYGYAFGTMGTIAGYAAIAAYAGAVLFLILGVLGLMHARRELASS